MTQAQYTQSRQSRNDKPGFRMVGSTEARPGILTSEMWMAWIGAIVLVVAAYISDTFDNDLGWALAAGVFASYILSRGLAKSGSREGPFFVSNDSMNDRTKTMQ